MGTNCNTLVYHPFVFFLLSNKMIFSCRLVCSIGESSTTAWGEIEARRDQNWPSWAQHTSNCYILLIYVLSRSRTYATQTSSQQVSLCSCSHQKRNSRCSVNRGYFGKLLQQILMFFLNFNFVNYSFCWCLNVLTILHPIAADCTTSVACDYFGTILHIKTPCLGTSKGKKFSMARSLAVDNLLPQNVR